MYSSRYYLPPFFLSSSTSSIFPACQQLCILWHRPPDSFNVEKKLQRSCQIWPATLFYDQEICLEPRFFGPTAAYETGAWWAWPSIPLLLNTKISSLVAGIKPWPKTQVSQPLPIGLTLRGQIWSVTSVLEEMIYAVRIFFTKEAFRCNLLPH